MITAAIAPAMIAAASVMFGCFIHHDRSRRTGGAEGSRGAVAAFDEPPAFVDFAGFAEIAAFLTPDDFGAPEVAGGETTIDTNGGGVSFVASSFCAEASA